MYDLAGYLLLGKQVHSSASDLLVFFENPHSRNQIVQFKGSVPLRRAWPELNG